MLSHTFWRGQMLHFLILLHKFYEFSYPGGQLPPLAPPLGRPWFNPPSPLPIPSPPCRRFDRKDAYHVLGYWYAHACPCIITSLSFSLSLSLSLSVCPFVRLSCCLSRSLTLFIFVCPFDRLSVYLSVYLSIGLSVCLSICPFDRLSVYLSVSLSLCQFVDSFSHTFWCLIKMHIIQITIAI